MSTVIPRPGGGYRIFTKGASEMIMKKWAINLLGLEYIYLKVRAILYFYLMNRCGYMCGKDGKLERFTKEMQERLVTEVIEPMACDGLRTISIAYKDFVPHKTEDNEVQIDGEPNWDDEDNIVKELTCICVVGIEDPVRPEVSARNHFLKCGAPLPDFD